MVIFELSAKEAQQTFTEIKKILSGVKLWKITTRIEITVKNGQIQLVGLGFTKVISSLTTGSCKLIIPVYHWFDLIMMSKEKSIKVVVTEGEAMVGSVSVRVQTTFFETDKILRSIILPINPKPIDFWKLQFQGYTKEELEFNQVIAQIDLANKELERAFKKASPLFNGFRITGKELRELVLNRIKEKEKVNFEI